MVVVVCYRLCTVACGGEGKGKKRRARRRKTTSNSGPKEGLKSKEVSKPKHGHSDRELPYSQV